MNEHDEIELLDTNTLVRLAEAEINQQVATAKRFGRNLTKFNTEMTNMVTGDLATAQECMYSLPRDGKLITGPTARFAELVQSCWGNNRSGGRVVDVGDKFLVAQGVFHDLERNTSVTVHVQRRITGKGGKRYSEDMIGVTGNAAISIALRNAVLKGVPKTYWAPFYETALQAIRGDIKTLADRRAQALDYLSKHYAVSAERACAAINVAGVPDIGLDELLTLKGMIQAIKDGDITLDEAFPEIGRTTNAETLNQRIKREAETAAPAAAAATGGEQQKDETETGPGTQSPSGDAEPKENSDKSKRTRASKPKAEPPAETEKPAAQTVAGAGVGESTAFGNTAVEAKAAPEEATSAAREEARQSQGDQGGDLIDFNVE